jgi:hypothetical protein
MKNKLKEINSLNFNNMFKFCDQFYIKYQFEFEFVCILQYIQQHKNDVAHPTKKQRQFSKG